VQDEIEAFLRRATGQEPPKPDTVPAEVVSAPPGRELLGEIRKIFV